MPQVNKNPAWLDKFLPTLVQVIPRLKTPIQLAGFALGIAAALVIRVTNRGAEKLQMGAVAAGGYFSCLRSSIHFFASFSETR
jgi:hypothetical protein